MKHEASEPDEEIAIVCHFKNRVMAIFSTALDALVCQIYKHEIGQRVNDFSRIVGDIVVLGLSANYNITVRGHNFGYLFTPLQSRGDRIPESRLVRRRVWNGRKPGRHFDESKLYQSYAKHKSKWVSCWKIKSFEVPMGFDIRGREQRGL